VKRVAAWAGLALILAGCGQGQEDPVADLRRMVERPAPPPDEEAVEALPEPVEPTRVTFEALQRSPFSSIPSLQPAEEEEPEYTGPKPDPDREPGPLEEFAIGSLKVVGTMSLPDKGWRAYVQAPDGVVYTVTPGEYMGQQYGRVEEIGPDGLVLRELIARGEGRWEPQRRTVEVDSTGG